MTYNPRIITPGKMIRTPSGKIARCPSFKYEFAPVANCGCFLNPDPPAWDSDTVYQYGDSVVHSGFPENVAWYSTIVGDNVGNEPGAGVGWAWYYRNASDQWDQHPPFVGVGKTPQLYIVTYRKTIEAWGDLYRITEAPCDQVGRCESTGETQFVVIAAGFSSPTDSHCDWYGTILPGAFSSVFHVSGWYDDPTADPQYNGSGEYGGHYDYPGGGLSVNLNIVARYQDAYELTRNPCIAIGAPSFWEPVIDYNTFEYLLTYCSGAPAIRLGYGEKVFLSETPIDCLIAGSRTIVTEIETRFTPMYGICYPIHGDKLIGQHKMTVEISWRPVDCDYGFWNSSKTYGVNSCVAWKGKFYRSCVADNVGNEPEEDATNICEIGYNWRLA